MILNLSEKKWDHPIARGTVSDYIRFSCAVAHCLSSAVGVWVQGSSCPTARHALPDAHDDALLVIGRPEERCCDSLHGASPPCRVLRLFSPPTTGRQRPDWFVHPSTRAQTHRRCRHCDRFVPVVLRSLQDQPGVAGLLRASAQLKGGTRCRISVYSAAQLVLRRTVSCRPRSAATWDTCRKCSTRVRTDIARVARSLSAHSGIPPPPVHLKLVRIILSHAPDWPGSVATLSDCVLTVTQCRRLSNRGTSPSGAVA